MDFHSFSTSRGESRWPHRLESLQPVPERVHVRGRWPPTKSLWIAVVGSREADRYALSVTSRLVEALKGQSVVVVSGGARGVDRAAHEAALDAGLPTVAVLAGGVDRPGPASNRPLFDRILQEGGALLSEHSDGTRPHRGSFPLRNRLIAALGDVTVIVSATEHGGALHTVRWARRFGRPAYAIPGDVTASLSRGCNQLISRGEAQLLFEPQDLSSRLDGFRLHWPETGARNGVPPVRWMKKSRPLAVSVESEGMEFLETCFQGAARTAGELAAASKRPLPEVQAALQRACLQGVIQRFSGNRYALLSLRGGLLKVD